MFRDVFLKFDGNDTITTQEKLFKDTQNTFTIEFWAKPESTREIDKESRKGISRTIDQRFAITPVFGAIEEGNSSRAGVGVSVGTNGVSIYEHTIDYLVTTLVFETIINDWTHIAVVYVNRKPNLYINGKLVKKGLRSRKNILVPSGIFGGVEPYGFYIGCLSEIRIWETARTELQIQANKSKELKGNESGLLGYWKINEGSEAIIHDSTNNNRNGIIEGAQWNTSKSEKLLNENMNVLFTFFVPSGGVETLNRQRLYALNKKGIKCDFLYSQSGTGLQNKVDTSIFITNKDDEIKDIIEKGNYEAIVVGSDLMLLKKLRDLGYQGYLIYEIQGLGFNKEYASDFLKNHAYPIVNNYCDAILYPQTPHLIEAFENYFPNKKRFCFHNCFNTKDFNYRVMPKKSTPIIGWVGRLEENKNWKDFLSIGYRLIKEDPSIQLWMFEDNTLSTPDERLAFEQKIQELHLNNHLKVYANQSHSKMAEYFSIIGDSGGFLCSTSKVEGFGYAVLEAMVCRCPVLSTDSDGVRSFITHNVTGKFFELGNIDQAVEEGRELLSNTSLREDIRQKSVEHIEAHFTPDKYVENFLNMISDLGNAN
ncbi:glycosyltransferase [Priestia megaterium]|uniref:glycosyltransferase n=1 Tax=Priestia megaterium TaxID=1404 RepID=UPI0021D64A91|nr:glycosyltransferase [Priestia megaterium]MCU7746736.1 glycosyltransferase [Priestia megaterium]